MKAMKVKRGTARAKRRAIALNEPMSAKAHLGVLADWARMNQKLAVQLFHKAASAKFARTSPFA